MSLDDIDKIVRNVDEVRVTLQKISMRYDVALALDDSLEAIPRYVEGAKATHAEEVTELRDIIEGLLAGWPHTEIMSHYTPDAKRPVLMKGVALERASRLFVRS